MGLLEQVRHAGVIGAGGAGFPTYVKLQSKAEYVLLNGAECEPLLRVDQQLMEFLPEKILFGLKMVKDQVNAKKAIIGIKNKHKRVIEILKDEINTLNLGDDIELKELPDVYPAGDEQVLVYELTGRVVPETAIPIAVGCVVVNTETALNIYNASKDEAVTRKFVTVAGDVPQPVTVEVPVGTPIMDVLKRSGIKSIDGYSVIDGGPMMGPLLADINGFVTKKTKGLVVLKDDHHLIKLKRREMRAAKNLNKTACEQCRMCTDLCPRYLLGHSTVPHKMVRAIAYHFDLDEQVTVAQTCCQCNLCEYFSCPAGINPKKANEYFINETRAKGLKYKSPKEVFKPREVRDYRQVPSKRLMAKLNILQFDKDAPIEWEGESLPEKVGLTLNTHVGAPAVPKVKVGDSVKTGDLIAEVFEENLGTGVHASIDGVVEAIRDNLIIIRRN